MLWGYTDLQLSIAHELDANISSWFPGLQKNWTTFEDVCALRDRTQYRIFVRRLYGFAGRRALLPQRLLHGRVRSGPDASAGAVAGQHRAARLPATGVRDQ